MLRFPFIFLFSFAALTLVACDTAEEHRKRVAAEYQKRLPEMERSGIVAGPDELTFEENQGVKLQFPMPEGQFLELLKRLNLSYDLQTIIPAPWHSKKLDVSKMERTYQIYAKADHARRFAEVYRAYVDKAGQVVYLENMFAYPDL
jgi:hypothetical protein